MNKYVGQEVRKRIVGKKAQIENRRKQIRQEQTTEVEAKI